MALTAIYCRVSDDKFKDDGERRQDIQRQVDKLTKFCTAMGWVQPVVYSDDARSAFKEDWNSRPQFNALRREIRAHHISRVVVEDLTRLSRRIETGLELLKEASEYGCTITSTLEGEQDITSANGWFKSAIAFMFAEWSSRSQSEKVKDGIERRAADQRNKCGACGVIHLGRHPLTCYCTICLKKYPSREVFKEIAKKGEV